MPPRHPANPVPVRRPFFGEINSTIKVGSRLRPPEVVKRLSVGARTSLRGDGKAPAKLVERTVLSSCRISTLQPHVRRTGQGLAQFRAPRDLGQTWMRDRPGLFPGGDDPQPESRLLGGDLDRSDGRRVPSGAGLRIAPGLAAGGKDRPDALAPARCGRPCFVVQRWLAVAATGSVPAGRASMCAGSFCAAFADARPTLLHQYQAHLGMATGILQGGIWRWRALRYPGRNGGGVH